jgi:hypothetical protein
MIRRLDYKFLERVAKIGEMLSSTHDGEVVNAARALNAFLRAEKMTFTELVSHNVVEKIVVKEVVKYVERPFIYWKKLAVAIHSHPEFKSLPQQSFIENMASPHTRHYSGAQQTNLRDIGNKLEIDPDSIK